MELLHVHYASAAVDISIVINLGNVAVPGEYILLGPIIILILVKLLTNKQTRDVAVIAVFGEACQLV